MARTTLLFAQVFLVRTVHVPKDMYVCTFMYLYACTCTTIYTLKVWLHLLVAGQDAVCECVTEGKYH